MNPLLERFSTPFQSVPFKSLRNEHFLPAIKESIQEAKRKIDQIKDNPEVASFGNTIEALEFCTWDINRIAEIFFNLMGANTNDELQEIGQEFSPLLTAFSNDVLLDAKLFERVKDVMDKAGDFDLTQEQTRLLEKTFNDFKRNGALLSEKEKEELRSVDNKLSKLSLKFGENVLKSTNAYELQILDKSDLKGLPESCVESARDTAEKRQKEGWIFTLDYPSFIPFMKYASNRSLRQKMHKAFSSRAFMGETEDNRSTVLEIVNLRTQRAKLLGYDSHAAFVLEERMAGSPERVEKFLEELIQMAKPKAKAELLELVPLLEEEYSDSTVQKWDYSYLSEKLKKQRFNLDDELLKSYFELDRSVEGIFLLAKKLFNLEFHPTDEVEAYHEDVNVYRVVDSKSERFIGLFYTDFYPRKSKQAGAWMTTYRGQARIDGEEIRPHASIVCNFPRPTGHHPSLLSFSDLKTLFHEFGHALHALLSDVTYPSLSTTNVYWDFVELPSQVLENWCYEKECLDLFAQHYQTGENLPEDLVQSLKASLQFHEAVQTMRQLTFACLDMAWHTQADFLKTDIADFERRAIEDVSLMPNIEGTNISCAFSHIFAGGYSAGYYGYKWAEVLDADAFEYFKENGLFDTKASSKFKEHILSKGGTEDPMQLYTRFRGREPSIEAMLRRSGWV